MKMSSSDFWLSRHWWWSQLWFDLELGWRKDLWVICVLIIVVVKYGDKLQLKIWKKCAKNCDFWSILECLHLKTTFFAHKQIILTDHCMNNYGEIIGPLLTLSIKGFFVTSHPNSWVILYWSASIVLDDFWSSGHCVSQNWGLQNLFKKGLLGNMWIDFVLQFLDMGTISG